LGVAGEGLASRRKVIRSFTGRCGVGVGLRWIVAGAVLFIASYS
jgi:hypothetical protein